jgi:5-formyltetrahydrofolate cyclo-ligase
MRNLEQRRKEEIRRRMLAARDALSEPEQLDRSNIIFSRVVRAWEWQQARTVLLYASFGSEVRTDRLMRAALQSGKRLILPHVNRKTKRLDLYFVEEPDRQLVPGTWSIREPDPSQCEKVPLTEVDCIIAPGVAFDQWGGRLGYGGGFYDRLLASLPPELAAKSLGLTYEQQIVGEVPQGFFDTRVSVIATELRLVENR